VDGSCKELNKSERWGHQMLDRKAEEDPTLFIFLRPVFCLFLPHLVSSFPGASWRHLPGYFSRRRESQIDPAQGR